MQDMLLLVSVAVVFSFGWFLMGKLDCFLETNYRERELDPAAGENPHQPDFCNPTVSDSPVGICGQDSNSRSNLSSHIFCKSERNLPAQCDIMRGQGGS